MNVPQVLAALFSRMKPLADLINQTVERFFVVAWPPLGEEESTMIDLSPGFVFVESPEQLCVVTTDEDAWTPCVRYEPIPKSVFAWKVFESRMQSWMESSEIGVIDTEYYEATHAKIFENIVAYEIKAVELLSLAQNDSVFGVRIKFDNDFVLSHPIADGNIFQTVRFNQNDNLAYFKALGDIELKDVTP